MSADSDLRGMKDTSVKGPAYQTDRPLDSASGTNLALRFPAGEFQELLVLVADEFDHFRAVSHDLLLDPDGEWARVRFRIVNRDVDLQVTEVHPTEPLGQCQRVGKRIAFAVEPSIARQTGQRAAEVVRLHNQRVTLPVADRVTVPIGLRLTLFGKRAPVHVDGSEAVIRFVHDDDFPRQLNDLARLRVEMVFERPLWQT